MLTPEQIKAAQDAFNSIDEAGGTLDECWKAALETVAAGYEKKLEAAGKTRVIEVSSALRMGKTSAAKELVRLCRVEVAAKGTREALSRQWDNMAFCLNKFNIPDKWYEKFARELEEDKQAIAAFDAAMEE